MKKLVIGICVLMMTVGLTACKKDDTVKKDDSYVIKTYEQTPIEKMDEAYNKEETVIRTSYYELSDGTWKTDDCTYKYRVELTGRLNKAEKNSTYVVLSNTRDITFEQAWKASGLSSNVDDYFNEKNAVIVGVKMTDLEK